MTQDFWNTRYTAHDNLYGESPNPFFRLFIDQHPPGSLLLPAEGDGRNAIYAAGKGWQVDAFDFSEVAKEKALQFAKARNVSINYTINDIADFKADKQYDAVALIYIHQPENLRKKFHETIYHSMKPGGYLVVEAFAKEQLQFNSGGPKDETMLYDAPTLCSDFQFLHILNCEQKELILDEGPFHQGKAVVLRMVGQRL